MNSAAPSLALNAATPATTSAWSARVGAVLFAAFLFFGEASFRSNEITRFTLDAQIIVRLGITAACGLYGLWHVSATFFRLVQFPMAWSVLLALWVSATIVTSLDPVYSMACAGTLWCLTLFSAALIQNLRKETIVAVCTATMAAFVLASWLAYFVNPELGQMQFLMADRSTVSRLSGLSDPNGLGRAAALLLALMTLLGFQRRVPWWLVGLAAVLCAATLKATDSRTSMLCAAAMIALILARYLRREWFWCGACLTGLAGSGLVYAIVTGGGALPLVDSLELLSRNRDLDEIIYLTGRTDVWEFAWQSISESPFVGVGYGCSRHVMMHFPNFPAGHAHNVLINLVLVAGLPAGVLLVAMALHRIWDVVTAPGDFADLITLLIVVGGVSESMIYGTPPDTVTLLWLLALMWPTDLRRPLLLASNRRTCTA